MGKLARWAVAALLCAACAPGKQVPVQTGDGGNPNVGGDAGTPDAGPADSGTPDAGPPDAGPPDAGPPDAGPPDAGLPDAGPPDAGTDGGTPSDGGLSFGGPGPWPIANAIYDSSDGIQEARVIGITTDETQNLWVATRSALYLMKPGQTKFTRFDASAGLHLQSNPATYCDDWAPNHECPISGGASDPGINEIVGGGPNEVFVGYWGFHDWASTNDGNWLDPYRHTGKLDRVRLKSDGTLEVVRFDMVSGNTVQFWHNRTVFKMVYDHFIHPHELYVGTDHGVDKFSPDLWKPTTPGTWFNGPQNNQRWMSDHLHPQACYHQPCGSGETGLRLGDWRGLAVAPDGDLWVAGRWAAGKITWVADNSVWYNRGGKSYSYTFGDPYLGNCSGSRPVFCTPLEGDTVNLSAVAVTKDPQTGLDVVWFSSGILYASAGDVNYGVAAWRAKPGPSQTQFTYYDPVRDIGMVEADVADMLALPDGRLVLAGPNSGLVIWDPVKGSHTSIRAGQGIPSDSVFRIELDTMVNPPALHVATAAGAAVLRILP